MVSTLHKIVENKLPQKVATSKLANPPNLANCYHDKHEKLATSGVQFMTTGWIEAEPDHVITGITCSTDGRKEAFLESETIQVKNKSGGSNRKRKRNANENRKHFRCKCGSSPGSTPNKLKEPTSPNDSSTLTSCSIHFWSCPV